MDKTLARINELAKKAKITPLTTAEKAEQKRLREAYLQNFRNAFQDVLLNSTVYDPEGTDVTPEKLKKAQRDMHLENAQRILKSNNITFMDAEKE